MGDQRASGRVVPRRVLVASFRERERGPRYGVVNDISRCGVCVRSDAGIAPGTRLQLAIPIHTDRAQLLIEPEAEVVWTRASAARHPSSEWFDLGLKFTSFGEANRRTLLHILESRSFSRRRLTRKSASSTGLRRGITNDRLSRETVPSARRTVLILSEAVENVERICDAAGLAGLAPVVVESVDAIFARATSAPPSLVILSESLGARKFSRVVSRLKRSPWGVVPLASIKSRDENPWTSPIIYPVDAILDTRSDLRALGQTLRLVTASGSVVCSNPPTALEGDLVEDDFCSVLQYLFMSGKRGRVTLEVACLSGEFYIDAGDLTYCNVGGSSGRDAFIDAVMSPQPGRFRFEPGLEPPFVTMQEPGIELLLEANRQRDHRAREASLHIADALCLGNGGNSVEARPGSSASGGFGSELTPQLLVHSTWKGLER